MIQMFSENSVVFEDVNPEPPFFSALNTATVLKATEIPTRRTKDIPKRIQRNWSVEDDLANTIDTREDINDSTLLTNISTTTTEKDPQEDKVLAYIDRVAQLRTYLAQEETVLNRESEDDFWLFVLNEFNIRMGNLVATYTGYLRIVWRDNIGSHLGLLFLGRNVVQFVIFKPRAATSVISRVSGRDTIEGVKKQISSFELNELLYERRT